MKIRSFVPVIFITIGVLLLFAGQSMAAEEGAKPVVKQPAPAIRVVAAQKRELVERLHVNGTVLAREEAVVSTDLNGLTVMTLNADRGDTIKKGATLATLDRTPLEMQAAQLEASKIQAEASVAQAQSQIADAEIAVRQAEETLQRIEVLKEKGHATAAQLDNAVNARDSARARLNSAHMAQKSAKAQVGVVLAQKRDVEIKLAKTVIKAPAGGLVLARNVTLGGVVSAQSGALFRIAIANELELAADVAETALPALAEGMRADVTVAGNNASVGGTIRLIAPEIDRRSRLGTIRISLPAAGNARVGNFASAGIEISRREGVSVPASAIIYRGNEAFVQHVENGLVSTTPVSLGARADGFVEVTQGIGIGDEVVHRAGTFVADGDRVSPVRDQMTGAITK